MTPNRLMKKGALSYNKLKNFTAKKRRKKRAKCSG
jgi:hypothetical protein